MEGERDLATIGVDDEGALMEIRWTYPIAAA